MSYVTDSSYGGGAKLDELMEFGVSLVPGLGYVRRVAKPGFEMTSVAGALALASVLVGVFLLSSIASGWAAWGIGYKSGMVGNGQWLGARHPNEIRLSDSSMMGSTAGRRDKRDTFFSGNAVGPEFVEQPNYVLGNENLMRTALSKFNRLKAQGAAVGTWPVFWAAYKAENSDDLDGSMYDFGDDNATSGFDPHKLRVAGIGS